MEERVKMLKENIEINAFINGKMPINTEINTEIKTLLENSTEK